MDAANRSEMFPRTIPCGLTRKDAATMMRRNGTTRVGYHATCGFPQPTFYARARDLP
jgi:hypothetical protein